MVNEHRAACLRASQFDSFGGTTQQFPDFSGSEFWVGYLTRQGDENASNVNDVDNFRAVFHASAGCEEGPPDLRIEKTDENETWGEERRILYTMTVSNVGTTLDQVMVEDRVPVGTSFIPEESDPDWICSPGNGEGSLCSLEIGAMPTGASREMDYSVRVRPEVQPEWDVLNEALVRFPSASPGLAKDDHSRAFPQEGGGTSGLSDAECTSAFERVFDPMQCSILDVCLFMCDDAHQGVTVLTQTCETTDDGAPLRVKSAKVSSAREEPVIDLFLLYRIRDHVLHETPGGREVISLYYEHTGDMLAAAISEPRLFGLLRRAVTAGTPHLRALLAGEGDDAIIAAEQVQLGRDFLEALKPLATQELLDAILEGEARLDLDSLPGSSMTQAIARLESLADLSCSAGPTTQCLNQGRFQVEVTWRDFSGGSGEGRVVPYGSDDSGLFWFFDEENWEMLVKVLDGCGVNGNFWVFSAATTNVEYHLTVTDTATGIVRSYFNQLGTSAPAITDAEAFATCP